MRRWTDGLRLLLVGALLLPAAWHTREQVREDQTVRAWLDENGLAELPPTRDSAIRVQQVVRSQFNCEKETWEAYTVANRPFLRHDAAWLLENREGLCGEGARLLVVALDALEIDAVRVALYDRYMRTHALVSIVVDGQESFVDSIFTPPEVNAFFNGHAIGPEHLTFVHYDPDLSERAAAGKQVGEVPNLPAPLVNGVPFFDKYLFYSYDGLPYTKLAAVVGLNVRILNLDRPPGWLGALAEKPHAIQAIAWGMVGLGLSPVVLLVGRGSRRRAPLRGVLRRELAEPPPAPARDDLT